jgi:hypothetical protein
VAVLGMMDKRIRGIGRGNGVICQNQEQILAEQGLGILNF